ncbi:PREDICTED: equilibrative nucleotide transporter 1-like [Ipomoea nil]|uniref:equilibrative nucleotide transporter 1-like n=1 Tax=Ipomoea nil TaxID=35883 RepID=UPI000901C2B1|nr:PREDICTED: equilibrative nucleotide transporter 1-like [Ipomoea nil]
MGTAAAAAASSNADSESATLLLATAPSKIPEDSFHLAYITYFTLGTGYLLPWNAFITGVDYFSYLYPGASVDRIFSIVNMMVNLVCVSFVVAFAHRSRPSARINAGLALFTAALVGVPLVDAFYVKGNVGVYGGFYVTVGLLVVCGVADGIVQGSVIGTAGELPERYMQAVFAGTAASGVLVSLLRVVTKAVYPQDAEGLRKSANLYFIVGIALMVVCMVSYNVAQRLPVIKYYRDLKAQAVSKEMGDEMGRELWTSNLGDIIGGVKWYGFGIVIIYVVTLSIFPGYITEDVHSEILGDWFPILLITSFNLFDLVGKSLTAIYVIENSKVAIGASFARLLLLPLFYGCIHGPRMFRTEVPVTVLTCLLGVTNGYLTSVLMMLGPKTVELQHAETAGIVLVLFLVIGLAIGSVASWLWVL